jgi:phosphopantothenoylcysteine decarboxylase/phosphopantothenate--cysteine ligase
MNHKMWENPATQENIARLKTFGHTILGPETGDMACGEFGPGRMSGPESILKAIQSFFKNPDRAQRPLSGLKALVTSGPTYEPIDPVRFIGNRSSGKQGHAIAASLAALGAGVTLVSGPVSIPDPADVKVIRFNTALEMLVACQKSLPADIGVFAAAVSDWSAAAIMHSKIKKQKDRSVPDIRLKENPDILAAIANLDKKRPKLVVGFAAETDNLLSEASEKRIRKGCDWIVANDVNSNTENRFGVFGAEENHVYLITENRTEEWAKAGKAEIAERLASRISEFFTEHQHERIAAE